VDSPIIEPEPKSFLGEFLEKADEFFNQKDLNQQIDEEINKAKPNIDAKNSLLEQIKARRNDSYVIDDLNKEIPEIDTTSGSNSNDSIEDILPEQVSKTGFNALFNQITSKRDDYHVVGTPNVYQIGLTPILERVKGLFTPNVESKTLDNKPSFTNLLDDTNALFDDIEENVAIDNTNIIDNTIDTTNKIDNNFIKNI